MQIHTLSGDATKPRPQQATTTCPARGVIIAHLCNHVGGWGKGFVLAVDDLSPLPRKAYKECAQRHSKIIPLGEVQFVEVEPNVCVANMVAQNGIDKDAVANGVLVDYAALKLCLEQVFERAVLLGSNVHIPAGMGSGLAGGDKAMIDGIIQDVAMSVEIDLLEKQMKFAPMVTLWEFDDKTAASYVAADGDDAKTTAAPAAVPITDLDDIIL